MVTNVEYVAFIVCMAIFVLFVFIKGAWDAKIAKKKFIKDLYENYGVLPTKEYSEKKFNNIAHFFEKHMREGQIDDITWNDLNMDEVYKRLNYTYSSAGQEYLYYTLRSPEMNTENQSYKEELITYFMTHQDERVSLQLLMAELGYTGKYSIYEYLQNLDILGRRSNAKHIFANLLYLPMLALCIIYPSMGLIGAAILIIYNMTSYFKEKNEIDPYIISFSYVMRLLHISNKICQQKDVFYEREKEILSHHRKGLSSFKRGSFWLMSTGRMSGSGNVLDIFFDYLRMTFHLDLIKFNQMLVEVRKHVSDIDVMLETIGYLETTIAIGAYRTSLDVWCIPEKGEWIRAEEMYHPLIEGAVTNSIETKQGVLLTGSNASGKSTFLKAVAINAIFAQTIHTCLAKSYMGPYYCIYSSMALRDNIGDGESYYIVEIKSIKRILDGRKSTSEKVLCFVDEVLRGTNTVERIAASTQILQCLAEEGVTCFAATHDIELAELLKDSYNNHHFEEEIVDGDVHFSYEIKEGKATTRNAIKLLSVMGYDDNIISKAEQMSERFLQQGIWEK